MTTTKTATITESEWDTATTEKRCQWLKEGVLVSDMQIPTRGIKPASKRAAKAAATRAANKAKEARMAQIMEALADEKARFNHEIASGTTIILQTTFGPYTVDGVDQDFWYHTHIAGEERHNLNSRSFAGCNDGKWADLLRQAGVTRHPLFTKYA